MKWQIISIENADPILPLYPKVFDDELTAADIAQRTRGWRPHFFLVGIPGQDPVGFAVFRGKKNEVELWLAGIIPESRRQGAGTCMLESGEKEMARLGYRKITVNTYNRWNIMLSMLFQREYRLLSTQYSDRREDLKMLLIRELQERRELRYALTEKCNFNCLFCHNEGLGKEARSRVPDAQVLTILKEAIRLGHTDITFTGGEPLLEKHRLHFLIKSLADLPAPPLLTIVTNASLLDTQTIAHLAAYPGKKKIHLSLHATDEAMFQKITRNAKPGLFDKVQANIREAAAAGLLGQGQLCRLAGDQPSFCDRSRAYGLRHGGVRH